jgi:hypothetical protein
MAFDDIDPSDVWHIVGTTAPFYMQQARCGIPVQIQVSSSFLLLSGQHEDSSSIQATFASICMYRKSGVQNFVPKIRDLQYKCRRHTRDVNCGPYQHSHTHTHARTHTHTHTVQPGVHSQRRYPWSLLSIPGQGMWNLWLSRSAPGSSTSASVQSLSFRHYFMLIFILILFVIIRTSGRRVGNFRQRIAGAVVEAYWTEK